MKGFIYDLSQDGNSDQFIKTTKELEKYVGRTNTKYTGDFTEAVKNLDLDMPVEPAEPAEDASQFAVERWKLALRKYEDKQQAYSDFLAGLYSTVLCQCSEALEDRLESHEDFPAANQDGIALLAIIKQLTCTFEESRKATDELCGLEEKFYPMRHWKTPRPDYEHCPD